MFAALFGAVFACSSCGFVLVNRTDESQYVFIKRTKIITGEGMFKSNVRELMDKNGKTIRDVAAEVEMSVSTVHRATQDETIGGCQLNTLAKIGSALGVKTNRLYDEVDRLGDVGRIAK